VIVSDIQTYVKRQFGDESGVQITDTDIIRWINSGQRHIVKVNEGLLEKVSTANTVVGQQAYALPTDCLILQSISYKSNTDLSYFKLKGFTLNEFNEYIDGWDGTTYQQGLPNCYTIFAGNIDLFPIPDTSMTSGLKIYYTRKPVDIVNPSDTPDLPELYHEALVKFCLLRAYALDSDYYAQQLTSGELDSDIMTLRGRESWKQEETYPTITVRNEDYY